MQLTLEQYNTAITKCKDIFEKVNGQGIEKLKNKGIDVISGLLEKKCLELNRRFFTYHQKNYTTY